MGEGYFTYDGKEKCKLTSGGESWWKVAALKIILKMILKQ